MDSEQARKNRTTHGLRFTPEYNNWCHMKARCNNPKNKKYKDYGGRGITVCDQWNADFAVFYADMGPRPDGCTSIDRIDVNGNYTPENCRWADANQQARNTRKTVYLTHNGRTMSLADWADEVGVKPINIAMRLNRGWSDEEALTRPFTRSNGYRNHA